MTALHRAQSFGWHFRSALGAVTVPTLALLLSALLFGAFVALNGANPLEVYQLIYKAGFGTAFSWQNTLVRSAPLLLTALCVALPARLGLVIVGAEGAYALGALAAVAAGLALNQTPAWLALAGMALASMLVGGLWIALSGALRVFRGVNETISSLLLSYIGLAIFNHLVEGPMRDPASLNKPSTYPISDSHLLGDMWGSSVHWGFGFGILFCLVAGVIMLMTSYGFAAKIVGGNVRAAQLVGLPYGALVLSACFAGGAAAGLAGMTEVAAVQTQASASLLVGYGLTGILVAFMARQNPFVVIPMAILFGGIAASGGYVQRSANLPDATISVLQGIVFTVLLASEPLRARLGGSVRFQPQPSMGNLDASLPLPTAQAKGDT